MIVFVKTMLYTTKNKTMFKCKIQIIIVLNVFKNKKNTLLIFLNIKKGN